jgi:hypothetical protein
MHGGIEQRLLDVQGAAEKGFARERERADARPEGAEEVDAFPHVGVLLQWAADRARGENRGADQDRRFCVVS